MNNEKIWIVVYDYGHEGYGEPLYAGTKEGAEKYVMDLLKDEYPKKVFKDYAEYYEHYHNISCYDIFELEVGE